MITDKLLISLSICAAVASCTGTETGNAADPVPIIFALRVAQDVAIQDATGIAVEVESAVGQVRRVDFDLPAGLTCAEVGDQVRGGVCVQGEAEERFRFEGPWVTDVLTGESTPSIDGLALPAATYRRVDVRLQRGGETSLRIEGTAGGTAFTLAIRDTLDARFEGEAAVVEGTGLVPVLLDLPLDAWFAAVDLRACVAGGPVVIDDRSDGACEAVYRDFTRALERSGRLAEDD